MAIRRAVGTGLQRLARQAISTNGIVAQATAAATEAASVHKTIPCTARWARGFAAQPAAAAAAQSDGKVTQVSN